MFIYESGVNSFFCFDIKGFAFQFTKNTIYRYTILSIFSKLDLTTFKINASLTPLTFQYLANTNT